FSSIFIFCFTVHILHCIVGTGARTSQGTLTSLLIHHVLLASGYRCYPYRCNVNAI
ncbi:hypothetical protein ANANG_G00285280, partial [Anguilla anguilla]